MSGLCSWIASTNVSGATWTPRSMTLKPGALEHDVDEVLADVVHVALDGAHQERADRSRRRCRRAAGAGSRARPSSPGRRSASRGRRSRRARTARRPPRAPGSARRRASVSGRAQPPRPCSVSSTTAGLSPTSVRSYSWVRISSWVIAARFPPCLVRLADVRGERVRGSHDVLRELVEPLARRANSGRGDRDRRDHRAAGAADRRGRRAEPRLELFPGGRVAVAPHLLQLGEQAPAMLGDRVRPESSQSAVRRLCRAEGHEHLPHRRRVGRDPPADPVARAERVRGCPPARAARRRSASGWRCSSSRPSPPRAARRNGTAQRGEIADRGVAAGVVDEHGAGPEAAARPALGETVPLERAQEPGRRRLRQLRLLHHAVERDHLVALDRAGRGSGRHGRSTVSRARACHRCHMWHQITLYVKRER